MLRFLLHWVLSALALMIVSHVVRGFQMSSFWIALLAAVAIGLVNGTLGAFLKVVTLPFTIVTFGVFLLFINALMLLMVSWALPGFEVRGYHAAFWGALTLSLLNMVIRLLMKAVEEEP
jgi:putative membrane protein